MVNDPAPPPARSGSLDVRRARRALQRQLAFQVQKARELEGQEDRLRDDMRARSLQLRAALEMVRPLSPRDRVLEVGSGAHGVIFHLGDVRGFGCDPLAVEYARLFPGWQRTVPTLSARGEALPFADAAFTVVICDNVVDHAEDPAAIVDELVRVLEPGGVLYFSVNVHHPVYALLSRVQRLIDRVRIPLAIGPFADHTVHLTPAAARRLWARHDLMPVLDHYSASEARTMARRRRRHPGDLMAAVLFKNARLRLIAVR